MAIALTIVTLIGVHYGWSQSAQASEKNSHTERHTITVGACRPDGNTVVAVIQRTALAFVVVSPRSTTVGTGGLRVPFQGLELAEYWVC